MRCWCVCEIPSPHPTLALLGASVHSPGGWVQEL
jgi:hypothetical protein